MRVAIQRALVHVKEAFAEQGAEPAVPVSAVTKLTLMEVAGTLTSTQVKQVLADLVAGEGDDPAAIAAARGFEAIDTSALEAMVDEVIAAQPDAWEKYRGRGQGGRGLGRRGDEGVEGPGRRQGRHRDPAVPPRLSARFPPASPSAATAAETGDEDTRRARWPSQRRCDGESCRDRDRVDEAGRDRADDGGEEHEGSGEGAEVGAVGE